MTDVTSNPTLLTKANQYSSAVSSNNASGAQAVLDSYPELANVIFNADKYNWMRDAILAIQKYYKDDVQAMIEDIANHAVGLDDDNSEGAPSENGYSITKIMSLIRGTSKPVDSSATPNMLKSSQWGSSVPHTYQIAISGITADDNIDVSLDPSATAEQAKAWSKAMVMSASQAANQITLNAYGKTPTVNIPILIRVHN